MSVEDVKPGMKGYGLTVSEQIPLRIQPNVHSQRYLTAKRDKLLTTLPS